MENLKQQTGGLTAQLADTTALFNCHKKTFEKIQLSNFSLEERFARLNINEQEPSNPILIGNILDQGRAAIQDSQPAYFQNARY